MEAKDSQFKALILAAQGYLELGMIDDGSRELDMIKTELRAETDVLAVRIDIFLATEKWDEMVAVAKLLAEREPEDANWWIQWAYAARRRTSLEAARDILWESEGHHPRNATIQFNLGCYECQLGQLQESKWRLSQAIAMDRSLKMDVLDEPDLEPLWASFKV